MMEAVDNLSICRRSDPDLSETITSPYWKPTINAEDETAIEVTPPICWVGVILCLRVIEGLVE
jgi:hypothetical protein